MATGLLRGFRHLRSAVLLDGGPMTDGQLLECFILQRDEAAFAALVRRHGPMVLGVCRRVLRHQQDAEDAFQATFLVLAKKANAIGRRELVGNWLYGAAYRAALEVKAARQRVRDRQVSAMPEPVVVDEADVWRDLRPVLDRELNGLPDKYRVPVVLCDLEGRTRRDVAKQLGVPEGTLSGRLTTARRMLAKRLARHGVAISAGSLTVLLTGQAASACVPAPLVIPTAQAASLLAAGQTAAHVVSAQVATLAEGVLKAMLLTRLKTVPLCIAFALLLTGGGVLAERSLARGPANQPVVAAEERGERPAPPRQPAQEKSKEPRERPRAGATVSGNLQAVDPARNSVTVSVFSRKEGQVEKTFPLARGARIERDGAAAKLDDLKKDSRATLTLSEDQKTVVVLSVVSPPLSARVKAVDGGKNTITLTVGPRGQKQDRTYQLAKDARITIEGKEAKLTDLKEGVQLTIWVDHADHITQARTRTGRRPAVPPDPPARPVPPKTEPVKPPDAPPVKPPAPPRKNTGNARAPRDVARAIDQDIQRVLDADRIRPSGQADDAEFLRRVYLDITGKIPTPEKAAAFLDSKDADKRARLIDELLASKEYGLHFADLWCDRIAVKDMPIYREPFIGWLADSLNQDRGWDKVVFDLVTAEGNFNFITRGKRLGSTDPKALLILLNTEDMRGMARPNPGWLAAESGRLFLGVQLQCAECHDHPFTKTWKQTDFWGLAAFFSGLRAERAPPTGLQWKETRPAADQPVGMVIPATALKNVGKSVPARLLGDREYQPTDQLLRHSLARWMTGADNPFFAKAAANRMWAHLLGRGLVDPVDDLREDNPASHPAILELLADEFKKSDFDLKYLIRCICLSQAYGRTSVPLADNADRDDPKYAHMAVKVMRPGVFYDSLKLATGWPELKVGLPERKTKLTVATLFTPREVFVDFFRSSQGEEANPLDNDHGIPQALKLMNTAQLNRVAPVVQRLASKQREQVIEQLYLTALARRPSPAEVKLIAAFLDRRKDATPEQGYSAVLWTLINSAEFVSNH